MYCVTVTIVARNGTTGAVKMQGGEDLGQTTPIANETMMTDYPSGGTHARDIVPILPTPNTVIFPGSSYPLTLRGEQAESLARAAVTGNGLAALFMQRPVAEGAEPTPADLAKIGTLVRLTEVSWADD